MKIENKEMRRTNVKKTLALVIILGLVLANFVTIASASPDLSEAAKDWLATNAGVGNCFVTSGVTYYAADTEEELTGATYDALLMLQIAGWLVETQSNIIVNGKSYNDYIEETGESGITDDDILWVAAHDEGPDQCCIGVTPTPTQRRDAGIEKMALTENCKKYIAQYLGESVGGVFCFTDIRAKTVKYWDVNGVVQWFSTAVAVPTIAKFGGHSYEDLVNETGLIDAAKLTSENGGVALTDAEINWIPDHSDGAAKYCTGPAPTQTPSPSPIYALTPTHTPTPTQTPSPPPLYTPAPTHTPTSSPISSPSPTPTLVDSDGDGVPDRYDYVPYDPNVQTKSDIKPETTPTPQPPGFEVPFVIVGLLLVAYLIKRRKVK